MFLAGTAQPLDFNWRMGFGCLVGRGVMKSFWWVTLGKFVYSQQPVTSAWVWDFGSEAVTNLSPWLGFSPICDSMDFTGRNQIFSLYAS